VNIIDGALRYLPLQSTNERKFKADEIAALFAWSNPMEFSAGSQGVGRKKSEPEMIDSRESQLKSV